jgi:hypothetical protein
MAIRQAQLQLVAGFVKGGPDGASLSITEVAHQQPLAKQTKVKAKMLTGGSLKGSVAALGSGQKTKGQKGDGEDCRGHQGKCIGRSQSLTLEAAGV